MKRHWMAGSIPMFSVMLPKYASLSHTILCLLFEHHQINGFANGCFCYLVRSCFYISKIFLKFLLFCEALTFAHLSIITTLCCFPRLLSVFPIKAKVLQALLAQNLGKNIQNSGNTYWLSYEKYISIKLNSKMPIK